MPKLPTLLSTQLRNILTHLEGIVGHALPVIMVRQNMDGTELEFANMLVEDSNNDALSYTDCELWFYALFKTVLSAIIGDMDCRMRSKSIADGPQIS